MFEALVTGSTKEDNAISIFNTALLQCTFSWFATGSQNAPHGRKAPLRFETKLPNLQTPIVIFSFYCIRIIIVNGRLTRRTGKSCEFIGNSIKHFQNTLSEYQSTWIEFAVKNIWRIRSVPSSQNEFRSTSLNTDVGFDPSKRFCY